MNPVFPIPGDRVNSHNIFAGQFECELCLVAAGRKIFSCLDVRVNGRMAYAVFVR